MKWRIFSQQTGFHPSDQVRGHALPENAPRAEIWLTNGLPPAPDSEKPPYLFVERVLFQLLNQY
jgi:hypothetical protein